MSEMLIIGNPRNVIIIIFFAVNSVFWLPPVYRLCLGGYVARRSIWDCAHQVKDPQTV